MSTRASLRASCAWTRRTTGPITIGTPSCRACRQDRSTPIAFMARSSVSRGLRFDGEKVLLDPYGRGVVVPGNYSRGAACEPGANTATAMKNVVVDQSGLRLGRGRAAAAPKRSQHRVRDARARLHAPSELRCPGRDAWHLCGSHRKDSVPEAAGRSPPSSCCRCFSSSTLRTVRQDANYWGSRPFLFCPARAYARGRAPSGPMTNFAIW